MLKPVVLCSPEDEAVVRQVAPAGVEVVALRYIRRAHLSFSGVPLAVVDAVLAALRSALPDNAVLCWEVAFEPDREESNV